MDTLDFDLFVIGAGSGGVRAARIAAGYGARVAVAEERYVGGTCVNVGCVPKKLFVHAAHYAEDFHDAAGFGWQLGAAAFDWPRLRENKDREIARLNGIYRNLLESKGVTLIEGRARVVDPGTVAVGERRYRARHILVASGAWPFVPEIPGREHVITSNEAFHLERLPRRAVVVGGGYIAVEFAGILNGLGVQTELLYRGPLFLRHFDRDLRETLAGEMPKKGVKLRFDTRVEAVEKRPDGSLGVLLGDDSRLETDLVLYATGRRPLTRDLGLEACGVQLDENGAIVVDAYYQSSVPSIHAIGDVIGGPELTPLATAQGMALASTLFLGEKRSVSLENLPTAIFSQPAVGTVGLSEEQARARHPAVLVYHTRFRALKHTLSGNPEQTFMKLVVDGESDRVLGVHMVGPESGEIIQGMAVALQAGATKRVFDATIGIHPTVAEEFVTLREPVR
ncbi:MAG: glutathione-disulfide reductase [Pseudomonadales bacterium]|jgi:glutathione reductase (NADPH)|nr:glutathione-disulfide reductase [Pseudomonadales bacterium]MBP9035051.1 glutathione-disulfide reductase [Pseudomonadales bacterium]